MALHDYGYPSEPLHRHHRGTAFDDTRRPQQQKLDQGTMWWTGGLFGVALLLFITYMIAGPPT